MGVVVLETVKMNIHCRHLPLVLIQLLHSRSQFLLDTFNREILGRKLIDHAVILRSLSAQLTLTIPQPIKGLISGHPDFLELVIEKLEMAF